MEYVSMTGVEGPIPKIYILLNEFLTSARLYKVKCNIDIHLDILAQF